jgi:hypothetical protein
MNHKWFKQFDVSDQALLGSVQVQAAAEWFALSDIKSQSKQLVQFK